MRTLWIANAINIALGGTTGVVLYYGANDATFRAVKGNTGQELWSFIAAWATKR